ncbi:MAG: LuxR family transcriptional regulator [Solirubrobacteraceae bacterium]
MRSDERPPLIVLDDASGLAGLRAKLERSGWRTQAGWALPARDWDVSALRIVCAGAVVDSAALQAALLAGARGAGLIILTPPEPPDAFLEDLARIGAVERRAARGEVFDAETVDLLRELSAGKSVADAAADVLISLRTAHRRLAAARKALGVKTNRELLTEYGRRYSRPG